MPQHSLTATQLVILSAASQRQNLRIELPERLRGGAAKTVLATLLARSLIELEHERVCSDTDFDAVPEPIAYRISPQGLAALGIETEEERGPSLPNSDTLCEDAQPRPINAASTAAASAATALPRIGSKLAEVINLLRRETGASINELTAATGWLAHTTRAALTGLRQRGHAIERTVRQDGTSIYRIAAGHSATTSVEAAS